MKVFSLKFLENNINKLNFSIFNQNSKKIFNINVVNCPYCAEESIIINNIVKICFNCKENPCIEFDLKGEFK